MSNDALYLVNLTLASPTVHSVGSLHLPETSSRPGDVYGDSSMDQVSS